MGLVKINSVTLTTYVSNILHTVYLHIDHNK